MDAFLTVKSKTGTAKSSDPVLVPVKSTKELASDDPNVSAFYAQLSDRERIAHTIAVDKLGTSYDVTRTHGYVKWSKTRS